MMGHTKVFISYARKDAEWLERLEVHLKPLERQGLIDLWYDKRIESGADWRQEIENALAKHDIAVLLISPDYLASDFIDAKELPSILNTAKEKDTYILPVIISPCRITLQEELEKIQAVNPPDKPLSTMDEATREQVFVDVAETIEKIANSANKPKQPKIPIASANSPDNLSKGLKHKDPSRWKSFVLPGLIGMILGLILGAILAPYVIRASTRPSGGEEGVVYFVGGGTVYTYLTNSGLFDALDKNQIEFRVMQGPTSTGAELFAYVHDDATILVMASQKLPLGKLQARGKPRAVFEAYLGADPLKMLLVAGDAGDDEEAVLNDAFGHFLPNRGKELDFADLAKVEKWVKGKYEKYEGSGVYTGSRDSGTRSVWETRMAQAWPPNTYIWDIRAPYQMVELAPRARIYLGSEVLTEEPVKTLELRKLPHIRLDMVDGPRNPVARGLYLYGFIDTTRTPVRYGEDYGYQLPKSVVSILKYVYKSNLYLLKRECLQQQIKYFHLESELESEEGWVSVQPGEDNIFGAEPCAGQPEQ